MTDQQRPGAFEEALEWRLREPDMDADGWRAFADWIDADPAHAAALARVDAIDDMAGAVVIAPSRAVPLPAHRLPKRWPNRLIIGGSALAAGIAAVVIGIPRTQPITEIATRPGEIRSVAFGDGSRAIMNGATVLRYSGAAPRNVEIASGEAMFEVRHDAANPFRVTSRGYTIEDVGTVFNVVRSSKGLKVAVAEGSVTFEPEGVAVKLTAGRELSVDRAIGKATVRMVGADSVGSWTSKLLNFSSDSLGDVAAALERSSGAKIKIDADLMDRPFNGSIRVSGNPDRDVPHLAALIGVDARHDGTSWILSKPR